MGWEDYWPWPEGASGSQSDTSEVPLPPSEPEIITLREPSLDDKLYASFNNIIKGMPIPEYCKEVEWHSRELIAKIQGTLLWHFQYDAHRRYLGIKKTCKNARALADRKSLEQRALMHTDSVLDKTYIDEITGSRSFWGEKRTIIINEVKRITDKVPEEPVFDSRKPIFHRKDYNPADPVTNYTFILSGLPMLGLAGMSYLVKITNPWLQHDPNATPGWFMAGLAGAGVLTTAAGIAWDIVHANATKKYDEQRGRNYQAWNQWNEQVRACVRDAIVKQPETYVEGLATRLAEVKHGA